MTTDPAVLSTFEATGQAFVRTGMLERVRLQAAMLALAGAPTDDTQDPGALMTAAAVRRRLGGVSAMTLWRLVRDGELRPVQIRGRNLYDPVDVDALIARGKRAPRRRAGRR